MVRIPLNPYPNQKFQCRVPINGTNKNFEFGLWYNEQAGYWLLSLIDVDTETLIFDNLPLLSSGIYFHDILHQLDYKRIGMCMVVPVINDKRSMPNDKNLGSGYIMIWGDNE